MTTEAATRVERLVLELFDGAADDPLAAEIEGWVLGSRRFRSFVEAHRDKIRKKLRGASEPAARTDVRLELRAALLLLADRRIDLAFEAYGSGHSGPDFSATFRGTRGFDLEVTRLRGAVTASAIGGQVLAKLRQLQPSVPSAVLVAADVSPDALDLDSVIAELRAWAVAGEGRLTRRGFRNARDFRQRLARLGAVLVWCEEGDEEARATLWLNREARIAFPEPAARAVLGCLRAG
jgi:hypothetical protein